MINVTCAHNYFFRLTIEYLSQYMRIDIYA